jgi:hypothetical protein
MALTERLQLFTPVKIGVIMNNFPHIISADNVQQATKLVQESYESTHGVKLKRSSLLLGMSKALKYANLNVMQSKQGTVAMHKDIPVWVAAEHFSLDGDYSDGNISIQVCTSEQGAKELLMNRVISDLISSARIDAPRIIEKLTEIGLSSEHELELEEDMDGEPLSPWTWSCDDAETLCNLVKDYSYKHKEIVFQALTDAENVTGDYTIECISKGIEPVAPKKILSVSKSSDSKSARLEGVFLHNISNGLSRATASFLAFGYYPELDERIPFFEESKPSYASDLRITFDVVGDHAESKGTMVAVKILAQYDGDHDWMDKFTDSFIANSI